MVDKDLGTQLADPHLRLVGQMDEAMYGVFRDGLTAAPDDQPVVIALTTLGGDPDIARAMGDDIRLLREKDGRTALFLGKAAVYSAGATFMAAFPVECRFLTKGTRILVHERQLSKTIELKGPLRSCVAQLKAALHEIEYSMEIEEEGFRMIIDGSEVDFATVRERAAENWYIGSEKAVELGLVNGVV